jgi:hypothetical protein
MRCPKQTRRSLLSEGGLKHISVGWRQLCNAIVAPSTDALKMKFLVPHTGDAICTVCGAALESWLESTHVPRYELIERPVREPE